MAEYHSKCIINLLTYLNCTYENAEKDLTFDFMWGEFKSGIFTKKRLIDFQIVGQFHYLVD